ncbi:VanZ family protein [Shimazuella soli]|uniref:VanZ family protein n=1 Tax=Shimazuella soli TaxID=1892854 RepID=UPI001F11238B|nr:VanZ family protein [Shimazuella soli]
MAFLGSLSCSTLLSFMIFQSLTDTQAHLTLISTTPFFLILFFVIIKRTFPNGYYLLGSSYLSWMSTLLLFRSRNFSISGWNFTPFVHMVELLQNLSLKNLIWYFGGNTLLFVPMGLFFVYLMKSLRLSSLCGLIFMLIIEIIQGITGLGVFDVDDLLMNTFGILIGGWIGIRLLGIGKNQKARTMDC